jgi:hypothetical protein
MTHRHLKQLLIPQALAMLLPVLSALPPASATSAPAKTAAPEFPAELKPLLAALQRARYTVTLAKPPQQGAYGLTDSRKRRIWIAPISIDLGIVRATLIHEAVHAAQGCPRGRLKPIGWQVDLDHKIEREISGLLYRGYPRGSFAVEREAFAMQSHPRAIPLLISALDQRCRSPR